MRFVLAIAACAVGCGNHKTPEPTPDASCGSFDTGAIGGMRPVEVHVPPSYDPCTPMPLVIMLHGYTATGALEESYLQLTALADARGFLYVHPDGTPDAQ